MKNKNNKGTSRRKFLDESLLAGTGLVAGALVYREIVHPKKDNIVKMITLDGQLVEVDIKHTQSLCSGRISNTSLQALIQKELKKNSDDN